METFEDIYNLFRSETDGEEFDSDDEALIQGNVAYRTILAERPWKFLKMFYETTVSGSSISLSVIADLDNNRVLAICCNDYILKKATFEQRKDRSYDYWVDYANGEIKFINDFEGQEIEIEYIYKPSDITMESGTVLGPTHNPIIAYRMILDFKEKDSDPTFYQSVEKKYDKARGLLINYNENLDA